jgi:acyl-CoA synthetase
MAELTGGAIRPVQLSGSTRMRPEPDGADGPATLAGWVRHWARTRPDALAVAAGGERVTWSDYDRLSDRLAARLVADGFEPGDRLATYLPDGPESQIAWLATEKAGIVAVGIGSRAGPGEIAHLVGRSGARAVLTAAGAPLGLAEVERAAQRPAMAMSLEQLDDLGDARAPEGRALGPEDIFMLNSTSGTTGLPKLVVHTQRRWLYFHRLAADAGRFGPDEVFCSALPNPFGFGLWTAHFSPALLGAPVHTLRRFDPAATIELLARERVTVFAAVTTQLIMLLNCPALADADLGPLRVVFTGGEAVPYPKAAEFEERTGCQVLQFYGSNETGAASRTTTEDDRVRRLTTAGRVIPGMNVRLFDPATLAPVPVPGRGQPGCKGPALCNGYWDDPEANAALYTPDGWMLMGDLVEIDADGYLTVVGRTSDIIIRGGKNLSAPAIEAEVMTHPGVAVAAAVAVPDPVFGERVGVFVETRPGHRGLTLEDLTRHLEARGVSREWFPERLFEMDELPRSSGGKVAKGELRKLVAGPDR